MESFYLAPLFAALANLGCFVLNAGRDHPFHRLMLAFYVAAGVFNFSTAMLCLTTVEAEAFFWWRYFNAVAWFSTPPLLVAMTAFVTGRRILAWPAGLAVGTSVLCLLAALIRPELYIAEFHQFKFGLGPITTPVGNVLGALPQLTGIALAAGLLLHPVKWNAFFHRGLFVVGVVLWWLPMFANLAPMAGMNIPPLHPIADVVMSIGFSAYLNRRSLQAPQASAIASNLLIAASVGVILTTLAGLIVVLPAAVALFATALGAAACLTLLRYPREAAALADIPAVLALDLQQFGLSRQEIRICELIQEGHSRSFIQLVLNVSNGTLRNHLKNIYAKVLPRDAERPAARDQLQRLTVFLSRRAALLPGRPEAAPAPEA
jgi:DNA-binding CsgD family transcriptional regulator